MLHEHMKS